MGGTPREVTYQSTFLHDNVVPILAYDLNADPPYFIMPLATTSLERVLLTPHRPAGVDLRVWTDIFAGVEEIHRLGLVHRDLKPANILEIDGHWAVGDFGLVLPSSNDTTRTQTGVQFFSAAFSAPELAVDFKNATVEADIYSLGAILWCALSPGLDRTPNLPSTHSSAFGDVILKATQVNASDRFASVSEMRDAFFDAYQRFTPHTVAPNISQLLSDIRSNSATPADWMEFLRAIAALGAQQKQTAMQQITTRSLVKLANEDRLLFSRVLSDYCGWTASASFEWDYCDVIADRLSNLYALSSEMDKVRILFALLRMGCDHNRWHVMRTFLTLLLGDADRIDRLTIEAKTDPDVRFYFRKIESSLNFARDKWPASIQRELEVR